MEPAADSTSETAIASQLLQVQEELKSLTYAISHDLRAPVRAITGFSQALKEHTVDTLDATAKHFLARVEKSSQQLTNMIDGLLALSRLTQADMQFIPVDIGALCESINQELALQFPQHHPRVTINARETVIGDSHLLRIALQAVLHNAWKFTHECADASIDINSSVHGSNVTLLIKDNGIGFDAHYMDRLGVPFQHLQARNEHHGLGLGLASTLRIINRHGGTLSAEPLAPGVALSITLRNAAK